MVVVVVVVVVEVVAVGGATEVVEVEVVVVAEAVVVVVVALPGVSEFPCGAEPEDDAEGAVSSGVEVAGATLGTGSTRPVPGTTGAAVDIVAVTGGTEEAEVGPRLLSLPEEQPAPTNPKTAAIAAAKTHFVFLIPKKPLLPS